jgi:hypothetical protein
MKEQNYKSSTANETTHGSRVEVTATVSVKESATENTLEASSEVKDRDCYDYACLCSLYDGALFEGELFRDKRDATVLTTRI